MTDSTLTKEVFQKGILKLESAFRANKTSKETLAVYYERVCFCEDESFKKAIDSIVDNEQWFPTIAVFLKHLPTQKFYQPPLSEILS